MACSLGRVQLYLTLLSLRCAIANQGVNANHYMGLFVDNQCELL